MKVIVAGTRSFGADTVLPLVDWALRTGPFTATEIVSGGASGVDAAGEQWAEANGVPIEWFPAEWDRHGKAAGPMRNEDMAKHADALLLVWDGHSRGSADMRARAQAHNLPIFEVIVRSAPKLAPGGKERA